MANIEAAFRPRARLLQLLGDQLIGNARLALFELVKNAYDADANRVNIRFNGIESENSFIIIVDDGKGMSLETLQNVWLEPGTDHKEIQRKAGQRTEKYHRLPLGEKGVGRFASHKLGNKIILYTRAENQPEYKIEIDWRNLTENRYMDEAQVFIGENDDPIFEDGKTGTQIIIGELRSQWNRTDIRKLWTNIQSISSPFAEKESFQTNFSVQGREEWLEGLSDVKDILNDAFWHFHFCFEDGKFEWNYEFKSISSLKVEGRTLKSDPDATLQVVQINDQGKSKIVPADKSHSQGIGSIHGEFYVFDLAAPIKKFMTNPRLAKDFLDENGGIRVYRDRIRVHNYGEKGVDWLGLDLRRVNTPTKRISNNIILGAIDISLEDSPELVEKTNREGFVENQEYNNFRAIILGALSEFENHREKDKDRLKLALEKQKGNFVLDMDEPLQELRNQLIKENLHEKLKRYVDVVERKYREIRKVVSQASVANFSLALFFHEIERGVKGLNSVIKDKSSFDIIKKQAEELSDLLEGFSKLLQKDSQKQHSIKRIVEEILLLNNPRINRHNIVLSSPLLEDKQKSFNVQFSRGLLLGALSNVIDNALHWLGVRWPDAECKDIGKKRAIYIGVTNFFEKGPALIIADNGIGIKLEPADVVKPFMTTKPDGMGLGMYYTNMVMELNGGEIAFPDGKDVDVPLEYDGAVIALIFKENK